MDTLYKPDCLRGCCKRKPQQGEWDIKLKQSCCKLATYNWLEDIKPAKTSAIFEVRFKNTHRGFYQNVNGLTLKQGDIVAVEAASGHDVGIIDLDGTLVDAQMKRYGIKTEGYEFKKIYRKAKPTDIEKWQDAIAREHRTMIKSRQISANLNLEMKIGDVEFQGDGSKATFYYIADERVDFRELIKILAEEFRIRIEMRQIGARQEAGLIGGIGVCGRELCCSKWMNHFSSVTTSSARWQDLSLNPQKLAGQCSKLKCCLNHEVATYVDIQKDFPKVKSPLETEDGQMFLSKTDVLRRVMVFSSDPQLAVNLVEVPVERVKEVMALNKKGVKVDFLKSESVKLPKPPVGFKNVVGEDSITRFDKKKKSSRHRNRQHRNNNRHNNNGNSGEN